MPLLQTFGNAAARAYGFTRASASGAGAMELISTQILASTATTVTFSSIPQTYKHLQLRMTARDADSVNTNIQNVLLRINGITNTYMSHLLFGTGSSVISTAYSGEPGIRVGVLPDNGTGVNIYSATLVDILDYTASTKNPVVRSFSGATTGASQYVALQSGLLTTAGAITSLSIYNTATNAQLFYAGSRFSLYGVLG